MSQIERAGRAVPTALELELEAIDRQQRRFGRLSLLAIVVSFVHMAAALALFSGAAWYEVGAALAMTALVDVATWALAGYFDYAARWRLARSVWIKATFGFALAISMFLNGAYLYANRPATLPAWMSVGIAGAFAVFVPMLIGVASLIRGELEDDRLRRQQQRLELVPSGPAAVPSRAPSRTEAPRSRPRRAELPRFANKPAVAEAAPLPPPAPASFANDLPQPRANSANNMASAATSFANDVAQAATSFANDASSLAAANAANDADPAATSFANEERAQPVTSAAGAISTTDVGAIVTALRAANTREFANARALARICGWSSSSSGPKALKRLLAAGAVRKTASGFELVAEREGVMPEA